MKDKNISEHMVKWEFDKNVTKCFDEMLQRSIPSYNRMRFLINEIVINHIKKNKLTHSSILDLGCSTGEQLKELVLHLKYNNFVGCECSEPMLKEVRKRFRDSNNVSIHNLDISKEELPVQNCGAVLSILTLQFIPIEYRTKIVSNIYNSLDNKGIFIFVEKIIPEVYDYDELYNNLYYDMKFKNGYSIDEIRDKKLKLEGVLVPGTNQFNINLLKSIGFSKVDIFWKDLNFVGYVALK